MPFVCSHRKKNCYFESLFAFYFTAAHFHLTLSAKISHFLTNALKFSCCAADEARLIYFYLWL